MHDEMEQAVDSARNSLPRPTPPIPGVKRANEVAIIATSLLLAGAANAVQADLGGASQQTMTLSASGEHDTNPAMLPDASADAVWVGVVTPGYNLLWSDGENYIEFDAALRLQRPSREDVVFNREDPTLSVGWGRKNDLGELALSAAYNEASTRLTELEDTGQIFRDGTRRDRSVSGNWSRRLNERAGFGLQAQDRSSSFIRPAGQPEDQPVKQFLNDTENASISANHAYQVAQGLAVTLQASASRVKPEVTDNPNLLLGTSDLQALGLGVDWDINDLFSLQVNAAQVWVDLPNAPRTGAEWNGDVAFGYESERFEWSVSAARQTTPSGIGAFLENTSASLSLSHRLSEVSQWGASANWRENRGGLQSLDNTFGFGELWISRDLSERWTVRATYRYREQDGGAQFGLVAPEETGLDITRGQVVSVSLNYQPNLARP